MLLVEDEPLQKLFLCFDEFALLSLLFNVKTHKAVPYLFIDKHLLDGRYTLGITELHSAYGGEEAETIWCESDDTGFWGTLVSIVMGDGGELCVVKHHNPF